MMEYHLTYCFTTRLAYSTNHRVRIKLASKAAKSIVLLVIEIIAFYAIGSFYFGTMSYAVHIMILLLLWVEELSLNLMRFWPINVGGLGKAPSGRVHTSLELRPIILLPLIGILLIRWILLLMLILLGKLPLFLTYHFIQLIITS
jgi:hypothetical protein